MESGRASRTALRVAIRRAAHQIVDHPPVLDDPIALPLLGPGWDRDLERASHTVARDFRGFMAARSRYVEDRLAESVRAGVRQYVVLGAGLDTFAYRNPFADLQVFEVDFPATQEWKRGLLREAEIAIPKNVTYVAIDFEHQKLGAGLRDAGLDISRPAFFGWLGVVPYLTREAFRATIEDIAVLPPGSALSFDYAFPPETLSAVGRVVFDKLSERVARAGEPFQLFFQPGELEAELRAAGFQRVERTGSRELNERYFADRTDGLKLSSANLGELATAWV